MDTYHVEFEPVGRRGEVPAGASLLEAARHLGVDLISVCGGVGICERCVVRVLAGQVSPPAPVEGEALSPQQLQAGYRLACLAYPLGPCKLSVPPESLSSPMRAQVEGLEVVPALEPAVRSATLCLQPPSLEHPRADAESLLLGLRTTYGLDAQTVDMHVLQGLSTRLREWDWRCQAHLRDGEVVGVTPAQAGPLGLAVDLGSTKIAGYLMDLGNGQGVAAEGMMNPQISYGEDIVSRLTYAMKSPAGRDTMQAVVVEALNRLAEELCAAARASADQVVEAVIVGNTAMHHLLLGLPVRQLALAPFVPAASGVLDVKARDIGLRLAPGAYVHLPPNIAGYVGSDHVAMLLATADEWAGHHALALDIGTNTEISLITPGGNITSLSCASGPAFEGYHIKDGTRATPGAIERVRVTADAVHYQTIGGGPPAGICGSGILDAVAQLYLAGVVGGNGRLQAGAHPQVRQAPTPRPPLKGGVGGGWGDPNSSWSRRAPGTKPSASPSMISGRYNWPKLPSRPACRSWSSSMASRCRQLSESLSPVRLGLTLTYPTRPP